MSQLAPVMLTAEQFGQLATKDYLDEKLKHLENKFEDKLDLRFNQLDYKIESAFNHFDDLYNNHERRLRKLEFRVY